MSEENRHGTPYADDALLVNESTSIREVQEFIRGRIEHPHTVNGTVVWNFSSHEVDDGALQKAVNRKLERETYVIPYQATGTWSYMFTILPEVLQRTEVLVYNTRTGRYNAYTNFLREAPQEIHDDFRSDMARRVHEITSNV